MRAGKSKSLSSTSRYFALRVASHVECNHAFSIFSCETFYWRSGLKWHVGNVLVIRRAATETPGRLRCSSGDNVVSLPSERRQERSLIRTFAGRSPKTSDHPQFQEVDESECLPSISHVRRVGLETEFRFLALSFRPGNQTAHLGLTHPEGLSVPVNYSGPLTFMQRTRPLPKLEPWRLSKGMSWPTLPVAASSAPSRVPRGSVCCRNCGREHPWGRRYA